MTAEKERAGLPEEEFSGSLRDAELGAASVCDKRAGRSDARDFREKIERDADRQSNIDEIGVFEGGRKFAGKSLIECAAGLRFVEDIGAIPACNVNVRGVLAQRESEGT